LVARLPRQLRKNEMPTTIPKMGRTLFLTMLAASAPSVVGATDSLKNRADQPSLQALKQTANSGSVSDTDRLAKPLRPTLIAAAEGLLDVPAWDTRFRSALAAEHQKNMTLAKSANSFKHYQLAYAIDGLAAQYEVTGNIDYLGRALLYIREVMTSAVRSSTMKKSSYLDDFMGWGAREHPNPSIDGDEYPLFESYFWRYVARLLRVMKESGITEENPSVKNAYDHVLAFLEVQVFDKWNQRGSKHIYRSRTHMASHWAYIALQLTRLTNDDVRRSEAAVIVDKINEMLRGKMVSHSEVAGGYFWDSVWNTTSYPGQDVAHGNAVVAYIVEAVELGEGWSLDDINALSLTLREVIWRIDDNGVDYAAFVDGSGEGTGWFSDGFIKLGRFDGTIQKRLESHEVGRSVQFFGNAALNAQRLTSSVQ